MTWRVGHKDIMCALCFENLNEEEFLGRVESPVSKKSTEDCKDNLVQDNPNVDIAGMVEIMLDAICSKREYLNINSDKVPKEVVENRCLCLSIKKYITDQHRVL